MTFVLVLIFWNDWQLGLTLTSKLVMAQSLMALLWAPLVTIWKPLAVAVCSSTAENPNINKSYSSLMLNVDWIVYFYVMQSAHPTHAIHSIIVGPDF